jgi:hypothetical protein
MAESSESSPTPVGNEKDEEPVFERKKSARFEPIRRNLSRRQTEYEFPAEDRAELARIASSLSRPQTRLSVATDQLQRFATVAGMDVTYTHDSHCNSSRNKPG